MTAIVIGTFSAVPYIHLQMESCKRFAPDCPVLVIDDASSDAPKLREICDQYGAEFFQRPVRLGHEDGDLAIYPRAISFAKGAGADLLVKISRRWIWVSPWLDQIEGLRESSKAPTFSNICTAEHYPFRTECVAFGVSEWSGYSKFREDIISVLRKGANDCNVECWMHERVKEMIGAEEFTLGYLPWPMLGWSTMAPSKNRLWWRTNSFSDYASKAEEWGLPYRAADFLDPDNRQGNGRCISLIS